MHISEVSAIHNQEAHPDEVFHFERSLKELKDLRSQLHYAADYSEATFLNAKDKINVVESTKEYICRAMVTVVDHLGSVSANLDRCIADTDTISDAELRINSMKQRLLSCELYAHKLALTRISWNVVLPRYQRRYLSAPITNVDRSNQDSRDTKYPSTLKIADKHEFGMEDLPLSMYTYTNKSIPVKKLSSETAVQKCDLDSTLALPVRDGVSTLSKRPDPTFHFQMGSPKLGRKNFHRKSLQSTEIMSLIRRIKRTI
ncbi:hypothetical protein LWI28_002526 [Acer negundo]|uniref:Uncharacterized protein n=1 Tax=Acer negundo TaxID=4023 RepID=A0AAD5J8R3_ACENE|nr:hypothetical protein LWI28_002526 [Acer negundo]